MEINNKGKSIGRRGFLKGLAISAASVAGAATLSSCNSSTGSANANNESFTFADTISWDGEYDVVVVGFGAAGGVAAKTAAEEGASVLLVDKAPEGHEGGNSRYCAQLWINGNGDLEATRAYYKALNGSMSTDEEVMNVFTEQVTNIADNYAKTFELNKEDFVLCSEWPALTFMSPEYPEAPGADKMTLCALHNGYSDAFLWNTVRSSVADKSELIDVWFESPGKRLIQDPLSKTIIGVEIERGGKTLSIRAKNGVVMTCGGFENNHTMVEDYLGLVNSVPAGTLYNTGDGHKMVLDINADLWHMEAYEAVLYHGGLSYKVPDGERAAIVSLAARAHEASLIVVGPSGERYLDESERPRHGHIFQNGEWKSVKHPARSFIVFDQQEYAFVTSKTPLAEQAQKNLLTANTIAELASLMDVPADGLQTTIDKFNADASSGHDGGFRRPISTMRAFDGGPYYAIETQACILNTQGGPRRNARAQIVDREGNAIPNLYSAGEFGGITCNQYQGGSNMAECLIFGQIAGKGAAAEKEELPSYQLVALESNPTYILGKETDLGAPIQFETAEGEYIGRSNGLGGEIVVKVKMDGKKIANVEVLQETETEDIGGKALEKLPKMVIDAQSVDIDTISGATVTSKAFIAAVNEALSQA